jgi:ribosome modulation factor
MVSSCFLAIDRRGRVARRSPVDLDRFVLRSYDAQVSSPARRGVTADALDRRPGDQSSRWMMFWRTRRQEAPNPDLIVASWKTAWSQGAQARWGDHSSASNPYTSGHERSAWEAGWRWATRNPDRRTVGIPRLAHPRRRASDSQPHLRRAIKLSVAGLTVFGLSKLLQRWISTPPDGS